MPFGVIGSCCSTISASFLRSSTWYGSAVSALGSPLSHSSLAHRSMRYSSGPAQTSGAAANNITSSPLQSSTSVRLFLFLASQCSLDIHPPLLGKDGRAGGRRFQHNPWRFQYHLRRHRHNTLPRIHDAPKAFKRFLRQTRRVTSDSGHASSSSRLQGARKFSSLHPRRVFHSYCRRSSVSIGKNETADVVADRCQRCTNGGWRAWHQS